MEVRTGMIMPRSAACHSTCIDCLSVTRNCFPVAELSPRSATDWRRRLRFTGTVCQLRNCFPVADLSPRSATDWRRRLRSSGTVCQLQNCFPVADLSHRSATDWRRRLRFTGTVCPLRNCFPVVDLPPRSATDFVGGYASPGLFDLFPMMSDCPKHACHIKARGPTGHDKECALQSLGIDMTRKIMESVRF